MSNVPMEALDPEELRRFLENQEVVGGGSTFGELEQRQFDELGQMGVLPDVPVDQLQPAPMPIPRQDQPEGPSEEDLSAQRAADLQARALAQRQTDAFSRLKALLSRVGLDELQDAVQGIITGGTVDLSDSGAIIFALREQPAYQKRFAGNAARVKAGLPELDPSTYVGLENSYRELMRSNGLPGGFYDQSDDFRKLIESDVSPSELQERVEQGYRSVRDADPEVKRQMQELYGVSEGQLTAYFLDPDKAAPLLTRQARAAKVSARGRELAGMQLTAESAEDLIARGFSPEEAQQAFAAQGQLSGLYQEMGGEEMLSAQEKLGATFGFDPDAKKKLERRRAQRVGEFQAGGSFAGTRGATSGVVETGLGTAQ